MTPYSFSLIAKAYALKLDHESQRKRWEIWHIAALTRAKKLPNLKKFMQPLNKSQERGINEADIKAKLKALSNGQSSKSER